MISLLDINVLIAFAVRDHPHNAAATRFLKEAMGAGWATCPLTENGFVRILGKPGFPASPGSTGEIRKLLVRYCAAPGHQFWPDDISFADTRRFPTLPDTSGLTDLYLLALAIKHDGRLVTFDRRIDPSVLTGGPESYYIIQPA